MHSFVSRFHARMVVSPLPEYNMLLCTIRQFTLRVCPCNAVMHSFVSRFHARMVVSQLPEYNMLLCTIRQFTSLVCPCNVAIWVPDGSARRSLNCSLKNPAESSIPQSLNLRFKHLISVYLLSTNSKCSLLHFTFPFIMWEGWYSSQVSSIIVLACLHALLLLFAYLFDASLAP